MLAIRKYLLYHGRKKAWKIILIVFLLCVSAAAWWATLTGRLRVIPHIFILLYFLFLFIFHSIELPPVFKEKPSIKDWLGCIILAVTPIALMTGQIFLIIYWPSSLMLIAISWGEFLYTIMLECGVRFVS